jgi:sulfur carrier protein ThiS
MEYNMIQIKIPMYMINKKDSIFSEEAYASFDVEYEKTFHNIMKKIRCMIPETAGGFTDQKDNIKSNIILIHNDKVVNKLALEEEVIEDGDKIEILAQFAGG